jgi:hypothetical protein
VNLDRLSVDNNFIAWFVKVVMDRQVLHDRLIDILRRHVRYDVDVKANDVDFVRNVYHRFVASREDLILDPNE